MNFSQPDKYCKLIRYIQYNFYGEKDIHQVHLQDIGKIQAAAFFDLAILRPPPWFFVFLTKVYISHKILHWFLRITQP